MHAASPMSLKITHHQIRTGRNLSLIECRQMELRLVDRYVHHGELAEGNKFFI